MTLKTEKVPRKALQFADKSATVQLSVEDAGALAKLNMVCYSGGVIEDHPWWGNLVFDLNGMQFPQKKFPILHQHRISEKIGYSKKPKIENGALVLSPDEATLVDTPFTQEFVKLSRDGFPYQASIGIDPLSIEQVSEKATAEVNGRKLTGPLTVFRKSVYMETSVCVFGWDSKTSSEAFSKEQEEEVNITFAKVEPEKEVKRMELDKLTLEELKVGRPDIVLGIQKEAQEVAQAEFQKEKETMKAELEETKKILLAMQKDEDIRKENSRLELSNKIWSELLEKSSLPKAMYSKVQKHVSYTAFCGDGGFQMEEFSKAVEEEIKDWESKLPKQENAAAVLGLSSPPPPEKEVQVQENKKTVETLLSLAGHKKIEK